MTRVAIFRPEKQVAKSKRVLEDLGFEVIARPILRPAPTGDSPSTEAEYLVFTSSNGVEFALSELEADELRGPEVCAIGPKTAERLEESGVTVDLVPEVYSSRGLVDSLGPRVSGKKVEVARSSEGSEVLLSGLNRAGAFVHETRLYELEPIPPEEEGEFRGIAESARVFLFTSSLTAEYFLELADDREAVQKELDDGFVGALGRPTEDTLAGLGVEVDLTASEAKFSSLAEEVRAQLDGESGE